MRRSYSVVFIIRSLTLSVILMSTAMAFAATETVLHNFTGGTTDGAWPKAGVVFGPDGALYGATQYGGAYQDGTIYKLVPNSDGTWTETVLYSFSVVIAGA
jgi:uncharacterized repeat protein (TIGR03803 family)